jgi:hypothetical protein
VTHPAPAGLLPAAAIDGKLLRGSVTPTGRVFLVAGIGHDTGVVLGQRLVADKRCDATVVENLLGGLDVAGMVLTLDALHTTKKTARLITEDLHAHYLLFLKANQPLALQAAQARLPANRHRVRRPYRRRHRPRPRAHRTAHPAPRARR